MSLYSSLTTAVLQECITHETGVKKKEQKLLQKLFYYRATSNILALGFTLKLHFHSSTMTLQQEHNSLSLC